LACTPQAYARAGGLPPVRCLEDVAFVVALERSGVTIRHEPRVVVYTSLRLNGRCPVGLSGQLRRWQGLSCKGKDQMVPSAGWLAYRFALLHQLRRFHARDRCAPLHGFSEAWQKRMKHARLRHLVEPHFLEAIECERLMWESFRGKRDQTVEYANRRLRAIVRSLQEPSAQAC
jgi:hypothetical protein